MPSKVPIDHYFDETFVESVRTELIAKIETNCQVYDKRDVHKLMTCDDWFVRRFLPWRPTTVDTAVKCVSDAMKWRHLKAINDWNDTYFPNEFYRLAACFTYLPDRDNNNVLIIRLKNNRRDPILRPHFDELARNYFIYKCEKIVSENSHRGFAIIFDCHEASLSNVDLDFARFIISTLSNYYAGAVVYVCVYELPWIFNQIWKLVRSWLDSEAKKLVRFATKKDISKLIAEENLPDYMGGTGTKDYRHVPKGALTIEEMARQTGVQGFCGTDIDKVVNHFTKLIDNS
ncbi:motile sperm domain-containing protein 2-like [Oppia nitens]|uniref:motile sperm domain-containing protein 2-like n=1 Tax=Oppia nitens TaxID=1686743 RepID=UPI0023DA1C98|nr:motile sperm domain-containing protein 2-like [Oppia nitens]